MSGQRRPVGGEGDVLDALHPREHLHEAAQLAPQQRLAAGQANLVDAVLDGGAGDPRDLLEGEQLGAVHEAEVLAEHRARHAVRTAQVAAIGDGDAQVAKRTLQEIDRLVHRNHDTRARPRLRSCKQWVLRS